MLFFLFNRPPGSRLLCQLYVLLLFNRPPGSRLVVVVVVVVVVAVAVVVVESATGIPPPLPTLESCLYAY